MGEQTRAGIFPSRSAAIHAAISLLRDRRYIDSYAAACLPSPVL